MRLDEGIEPLTDDLSLLLLREASKLRMGEALSGLRGRLRRNLHYGSRRSLGFCHLRCHHHLALATLSGKSSSHSGRYGSLLQHLSPTLVASVGSVFETLARSTTAPRALALPSPAATSTASHSPALRSEHHVGAPHHRCSWGPRPATMHHLGRVHEMRTSHHLGGKHHRTTLGEHLGLAGVLCLHLGHTSLPALSKGDVKRFSVDRASMHRCESLRSLLRGGEADKTEVAGLVSIHHDLTRDDRSIFRKHILEIRVSYVIRQILDIKVTAVRLLCKLHLLLLVSHTKHANTLLLFHCGANVELLSLKLFVVEALYSRLGSLGRLHVHKSKTTKLAIFLSKMDRGDLSELGEGSHDLLLVNVLREMFDVAVGEGSRLGSAVFL
mmetsp:Transcript_22038/g.34676  ORF Transcript_22038/g.34676 Transcript_22038/m.34676 type:complete len:383 (+) Transcript_22038:554-1702(+)